MSCTGSSTPSGGATPKPSGAVPRVLRVPLDADALEGESGVYRGREKIDRYFADLDEVFTDWQFREHVCVDAGDGLCRLVYRIAGQGRGSGAQSSTISGSTSSCGKACLTRGDTYLDRCSARDGGAAAGAGRRAELLRDYGASVAAATSTGLTSCFILTPVGSTTSARALPRRASTRVMTRSSACSAGSWRSGSTCGRRPATCSRWKAATISWSTAHQAPPHRRRGRDALRAALRAPGRSAVPRPDVDR